MERERRGVNGFELKLLAMMAMICSHVSRVLLGSHAAYVILDVFGRISFPIFCFLLVEGFCHTGNRVRYLLRLLCFAILSEIPYDLAIFNRISDMQQQNVLFTMLIGYMVLMGMERLGGYKRYLALGAGMLVAWCLRVDYSFYGIWLIGCFYLFRGMKRTSIQIQMCSHMVAGCLYGWIQVGAMASVLPIYLYNGERGRKCKYLFYCFYPLHFLFLVYCKLALSGNL